MANNLLKGKRGIIFGALDDKSLAWKIAERCVEEGAQVTLTNAPVALRFGNIDELAEKLNTIVIPADATSIEDLENLFDESIKHLGGKIDFVLHSIGMSVNVRKKREYTNLKYEWMTKTLDVSAISLHKILQIAYQKDALNDWASVLALSFLAAQRTFPQYSEMAESKALLESIARSFGYHYGEKRKVRVNIISQSPTKTTAGSGVADFDTFFDYAEDMSPLGNASAEACADYAITMFSDLTRYVTMQTLFHDGGYSMMGMSASVLK